MKRSILVAVIIAVTVCSTMLLQAQAGPRIQKCPGRVSAPGPQPQCGMELTCTDKFVRLGFPDSVCFRASCPGVWALIHKRTDQTSFRRRYFQYRHYNFAGHWVLKDQGTIEASVDPARELFLVLPDDLIEIRLASPDCHAKVDVRNLGYIKKGSVVELQKWLAYRSRMENPARTANRPPAPGCGPPARACAPPTWLDQCRAPLADLFSTIGLPLTW